MATYEESVEIEKKYSKYFTKKQVWFLFFAEVKSISKENIEKHLNSNIKDLKEIDEKFKYQKKYYTNRKNGDSENK